MAALYGAAIVGCQTWVAISPMIAASTATKAAKRPPPTSMILCWSASILGTQAYAWRTEV
jgi:hypothetical protein